MGESEEIKKLFEDSDRLQRESELLRKESDRLEAVDFDSLSDDDMVTHVMEMETLASKFESLNEDLLRNNMEMAERVYGDFTGGMSASEKKEFYLLLVGINFTDEEDRRKKLTALREAHFPWLKSA